MKHPNLWHRGSTHQSVLSLEMTEQEITQQQIWVNRRCFQQKTQRYFKMTLFRQPTDPNLICIKLEI